MTIQVEIVRFIQYIQRPSNLNWLEFQFRPMAKETIERYLISGHDTPSEEHPLTPFILT